ncbi:hypothetical protein CsSME_00041810 [Camellia sinensis var. sinensis]
MQIVESNTAEKQSWYLHRNGRQMKLGLSQQEAIWRVLIKISESMDAFRHWYNVSLRVIPRGVKGTYAQRQRLRLDPWLGRKVRCQLYWRKCGEAPIMRDIVSHLG